MHPDACIKDAAVDISINYEARHAAGMLVDHWAVLGPMQAEALRDAIECMQCGQQDCIRYEAP